MWNIGCGNIFLSHRFLMSVLAMLLMWPMIKCSTGQKLAHIYNVKSTQKGYINLFTQQFELLKLKCKTVVVITHFVTGQCKSVCHHTCAWENLWQAGGRRATMLLLKTNYCMQLEDLRERIRMLVQKSIIKRRLENGKGGLGDHVHHIVSLLQVFTSLTSF
jgi:hypothetical protein